MTPGVYPSPARYSSREFPLNHGASAASLRSQAMVPSGRLPVGPERLRVPTKAGTDSGDGALHASLHALAGVSGAVVATVCVYPLDSLRTVQSVKGVGAGSLRQEALKILKREGCKGLYRGLRSAMWGVVVSWGVYFFVYIFTKSHLKRR